MFFFLIEKGQPCKVLGATGDFKALNDAYVHATWWYPLLMSWGSYDDIKKSKFKVTAKKLHLPLIVLSRNPITTGWVDTLTVVTS